MELAGILIALLALAFAVFQYFVPKFRSLYGGKVERELKIFHFDDEAENLGFIPTIIRTELYSTDGVECETIRFAETAQGWRIAFTLRKVRHRLCYDFTKDGDQLVALAQLNKGADARYVLDCFAPDGGTVGIAVFEKLKAIIPRNRIAFYTAYPRATRDFTGLDRNVLVLAKGDRGFLEFVTFGIVTQ